jgi:AcrR family transcriptional regulator
MQVFWRKGYEGASLTDLTEAMGINRPSLYAAYGNKEALFRKAVERYSSGPAAYMAAALNEPTARAVAERLLYGNAELVTDPCTPPGCMVVRGALSGGTESEAICADLTALRVASQTSLRLRFERAIEEGDLPPDADPSDLARYLATISQGMAVLATCGTSHEELRRVVDIALRAWPTVPQAES